MMILDFLVFTLSFHSWACLWITFSDCCNPYGELLITNRSSAYISQFSDWLPDFTPGQLCTLKYSVKSFINKENNTGLKPSPCRMPLLHRELSVIVFWLTFTQLLIDEYIDLMTFRNFPFIPSFVVYVSFQTAIHYQNPFHSQ